MREPGQIKRAPRIAAWHRATLIDADGCETAVVVTDISKGGFRLKADRTLAIGEYVQLRVDRYGDFRSQIRWALGNEAGGTFLEPISLA